MGVGPALPGRGSRPFLPHNRGMTDDRIIAAGATREDEGTDASIRPKRMADYLGQAPVREQL